MTEWFDALDDGVVLIEGERVIRMNVAAGRLLGTTQEKALGVAPIAALRDHRLERAWRESVRIELSLRGRSIVAEGVGASLILRDVTDVREAQENARDLLAVLSHELRTPVTTVRATLEALGYDDLPSDTRERFLQRAMGEADRLVRLLGDLTVDVRPPRERSVELGPVAERACAVLSDRLSRHRVEVIVDVAELTVWADPDKVMQVLVNLIENAAIHGPDDATIEVVASEEEGMVTLRVRDHGTPLEKEIVEALFEPHSRGAQASDGGEGLGLYVVRSIAERWGGKAWGGAWHESGGLEQDAGGNEFGVTAPARRPSSAPPRTDVQNPSPVSG